MAKHTITNENGETRTLEVEHVDNAEVREDGVLLGRVAFSYKPGTKTPQYQGTPINGQPGKMHKTRKAAIAEVATAPQAPAEDEASEEATPGAPAADETHATPVAGLTTQLAEATANWNKLNREGADQSQLDEVADRAQALCRQIEAQRAPRETPEIEDGAVRSNGRIIAWITEEPAGTWAWRQVGIGGRGTGYATAEHAARAATI